MRIDVVTLFPEMFTALGHGIVGRAQRTGLLQVEYLNPRDYTQDRHKTVDDSPYGGGPGMVMKVQPLRDAIATARQNAPVGTKVVYLSPQGRRLDQGYLRELTSRQHIILVAGRYEGIDERLISTSIDEELSIGDYVLSGGELAVMVVVDGITRLLPGALGDNESAQQDSFVDGLLDYPHYTRPEIIDGLAVPEVLLSGDHQAIATWRMKQALGRTWLRRPDLLGVYELSAEQEALLAEFILEQSKTGDYNE